jgi:elongation factor P hydroxylase
VSPGQSAASIPVLPCAVRVPGRDTFEPGRLERSFSDCFSRRWRTRLVGGADEPWYQPAADQRGFHLLCYRSDYFASALHETAHWCIAGERRRQLPDFGYWYAPDGRNPEQQLAFEAVEAKPQALEWLFSLACGYRFRISVDNLGAPGGVPDTEPFRRQVVSAALLWQGRGLPARANLFFEALVREFGTGCQLRDLDLNLSGLST